MSHGTPSCRTPRQKNIEEEEAGEIGLLVVEAFKKDKTAKIWGNLFWKNIQGKGKVTQSELTLHFCFFLSSSSVLFRFTSYGLLSFLYNLYQKISVEAFVFVLY